MAMLDSFLVLTLFVFLNNAPATITSLEVLALLTAVTATAWVLWRKLGGRVPSLLFAVCAFAVFIVANNPFSIIALWCAFVSLRVSCGRIAPRLYGALIVAACFAIHLFAGSEPPRILTETIAGVLVAAAGIGLATTVADQAKATAQLRELALTRERERIAATLHDALGHRLTTIGMSLDYAARVTPKAPDDAIDEISRARQSVSAALSEMRATVRALTPAQIVEGDIEATLHQVAESFDSTSLDVDFTSNLDAGARFSAEQSALMLGFTQEALTNVVRHAGASRVVIRIDNSGIDVSDDGFGNDSADSFGLRSLRERARSLGGSVATSPHGGIDGGFRITLTLRSQR